MTIEQFERMMSRHIAKLTSYGGRFYCTPLNVEMINLEVRCKNMELGQNRFLQSLVRRTVRKMCKQFL